MKLLCFDPSGNWSKNEGKGSSGWASYINGHLTDFGEISAEKFTCIEKYWQAHQELILGFNPDTVVCESYKLQPGKAAVQSWSSLETPQLIGYLRMCCWPFIDFVFQDPKDKITVGDALLVKLGVLEKKSNRYYALGRSTNDHIRDSIRHGIFYLRGHKNEL